MAAKRQAKIHLARFFGLTSFISISVTALLIIVFIRGLIVSSVEAISEQGNSTLTNAAVSFFSEELNAFIELVERDGEAGVAAMMASTRLRRHIHDLLRETSVVRVKIYDWSGRVIYSTKSGQIGRMQEGNLGFAAAISGNETTRIIYRDTFNLFDEETAEDNLVQTYVPIHALDKSTVVGVFEIYSDINEQIKEAGASVAGLIIGVVVVMVILFGILFFHIKRAERVVKQQQRENRERQHTLEILSSKMLTAQEDEKKRIANELHEDVVQTLVAVKFHLENQLQQLGKDTDSSTNEPDPIVKVLQDAARKIRAVAVDLRNPSLDDFGLKTTITSMVKEYSSISDDLNFVATVQIPEEEIPLERKNIIYRILNETLTAICKLGYSAGTIKIDLMQSPEGMKLGIETNWRDEIGNDDLGAVDGFGSMREKTILSGGDFSSVRNDSGSVSRVSVWPH
ncbi:MAG: hypothetical protein JMN25_11170 [gamma proteobacterium endosymbiont of Lamellibrachia anaximandri]|nr:hypothetical protein [gamma proteobacterium endosymbiont of Lamellibrachia anaximandri]